MVGEIDRFKRKAETEHVSLEREPVNRRFEVEHKLGIRNASFLFFFWMATTKYTEVEIQQECWQLNSYQLQFPARCLGLCLSGAMDLLLLHFFPIQSVARYDKSSFYVPKSYF